MQPISSEFVNSWATSGGVRFPTAISAACPHCDGVAIFSGFNRVEADNQLATGLSAQCPRCRKVVSFWAVRNVARPVSDANNPSGIFMHPAAKNRYQLRDFSDDIPPALARAFISTVDALNSKNFTATAVCARRTLEGIFKYLVAEDKRKKPLVGLIEEAASSVDFSEPIKSLSHAIRSGGNLGAHFDDENEPTEPVARQMVELLDYLISFLYVLPQEIKKLEESLAAKGEG